MRRQENERASDRESVRESKRAQVHNELCKTAVWGCICERAGGLYLL